MFNAVVHGMGRLLAALYDFLPNYGIGIILLTVMVRVAMIPLAVKQFHIMEANRANAEKMRKLLPEVKKIKEKYRDDRARVYEEQKKLYDQHEVNMLGGLTGCLPMLVQMPIFMAMYQVLSGCNKIFGSGRVCEVGYHVPDGSALKSAILAGRDTFLGINLNLQPSGVLSDQGVLSSLPYYLLVALMGYTMWYQTRQMMRAQPVVDPQMAQTQKIMQFMPLLIVIASLNFPAGLTLYWSASNVWSIGQQGFFLRKLGPARTDEEVSTTPNVLSRLKGLVGGRAEEAPVQHQRTKPAAKPAPSVPAKKKSVANEPTESSAEPAASVTPVAKKPAAAKAVAGSTTKAAGKKPGTAKTGSAAAKPAGSKPRSGGSTPRASSAGARKPAASRARTGAASKPSSGSSSPAKSSGGKAGGGGAASGGAAATPAGRPKGSGARKKSKGGHR